MNRSTIINALALAGAYLYQHAEGKRSFGKELQPLNEIFFEDFEDTIENEYAHNGWFTSGNVRKALHAISINLTDEKLNTWLAGYPMIPVMESMQKKVGIVMAGNIPLVGFHDLLSVIISGHRMIAKPSTKDERLIKKITDLICHINPDLKNRIAFTEGYLKSIDAIIATGSDNSSRYFEYYFRDVPHIIRKNRNGIAIITGNETEDELHKIGEDIFAFFGLGCRNVTKIYMPAGFQPANLLKPLESFGKLTEHNKYKNNLDYHRTLYLLNKEPFLDNGVVLFRESEQISSPVGVVYYEKYTELESLKERLKLLDEQIQCIVTKEKTIKNGIRPGESQYPELWDYADGIDTLEFLTDLVN
ncbi:MAG: hypothetical protein K9J30_04965 [Bacteroidales bacterium]|nr:hypothetical protein [Bacteroidales bacterium]